MATSPYNTSVTEALRAIRSQLTAGVMFDKAIAVSARACRGEARRAFEDAGQRAAAGADIEDVASALIPVLSFSERAMIVTAWNGGRIDAALAAIIDRRALMAEVGRKIKGSMIQPIFVLVIASYVSPLPAFLLGQVSMESYLVQANIPLAIAFVAWQAGRAVFMKRARELARRGLTEAPAPPTTLDFVMFNIPFVGYTERMKNLAEFCSLLHNLTLAGVQVRQGFGMLARAMPNGLYRQNLVRVQEELQRGNTIASAMTPGRMWPQELIDVIDVAEASGDLDNAMERQARFYLDRYTESVRRWGIFIARFAYGMVCLFVIYHIFKMVVGPLAQAYGTALGNKP